MNGSYMNQSNISIKLYNADESNREKWNSYLKGNKHANFYQLFEWQLLNSRYFKHDVSNLVAEKNNEIVGVFPFVSLKSLIFGHVTCSMPFVNYGSSCTDTVEIEKELIQFACQMVNDRDARYLEIRSQKPSENSLKESTNKISLTINLDSESENIWNNYKSKHRTNIRRVYKNGITVKKGGEELLTAFYKVISMSWRDLGTPIYSIEYFKQIFKYFKNDIKIFVAYKDQIPVAAALNGYYKGTVEGMWLGINNQFRKYQPSYVLYWEMIKDACDSGYKQYHLGRSSVDSGGESFKKKWNADVRQLYWQFYLNKTDELPNLNPSNPKYKLAIRVWRKLPLKITQLIGPLISKYIP